MPIKRLFNTNKIIFISIVLFALSACTGSRDVVTYDNSVEYRNAITLPPLKKPSKLQSQQQSKPTPIEEPVETVSNNENVEDPQVLTEDQFENESPVVIDIEPNIEIVESESDIEETELKEERISSVVTEKKTVNARVIEPNASSARLQIEDGFAGAWDFLNENLKSSDITVYNRNQTAQRFAIGCGDMEEEPLVTKRGGWSFFNRKPQKTEHCSLLLASSKSNTTVAVLSRSGEEVAAKAAKELFTRLLNN